MSLQVHVEGSPALPSQPGTNLTLSPDAIEPTQREGIAQAIFEYTLALGMALLSFPVVVLVAVLVKCTSRGPVLYTQMRVGRNGKPFLLYKVRTMVVDSEKNGAVWCKPGDTRVTRVGRFLRATHLDELPQLWNVLLGHMRLIGPRPERPEFVPGLAEAISHYSDRLQVRPGITGLAQVQQGADTDLNSVRIKLTYDLWYTANQSLWLDIRIMLATGLKLCKVPFPALRWLFRFPTREAVLRAYLALDEVRVPLAVKPDSSPSLPALTETPVSFQPQLLLNSSERV